MRTKKASLPFRSAASACSIAALCGACQQADTREDAGVLQGYWEGGDTSVNVSGNELFFYRGEDFWYESEFALRAGTDPEQFHATILSDATGTENEVGTVVGAIFKVEDETLTLVAYGAEEEPPESFDDVSGTLGVYELERSEPRAGRIRPPAKKPVKK